MKQNKFSPLIRFSIVGLLSAQFLFAEDTLHYAMPQVVVQSSRLSLSVFDMNQSVSIIPQDVLQSASPISAEDALRMFTTTEIRRRGAMGIQADVGVRGSTFSQQLILLNGTRINDPQTAHHNFDLPVSMNSIKQIEVIRGPNSAQYGPDAFGGVINIVTNTTSPMLSVELSGGQFGYAGGMAAYGLHQENFHSLNTVDYKRSDGFQYDTEFENLSLSSQNTADVSWGKIHFFSGYTKKDFGAFDFYTPPQFNSVPSHEKTETFFNSLGVDFTTSEWNISAKFSHRHHFDEFIYTILNPPLSHNKHNSNQYVAEIGGTRIFSSSFSLSNSIEVTADNINSTKLGIHKRQFAALSIVTRWIPEEQLSVDGGIRIDGHSDYGVNIHPIVNVGYLLTETSKLYASAGTSFRAPSYTELYYGDPGIIGNASLKPERGSSFEIGYHATVSNALSLQSSLYLRQIDNMIDYFQYFTGDKFHANNLSEVTIKGAELQLSWSSNDHSAGILKNAFFGYTYIDSHVDIKNAISIRYSLTHPKHQLNGSLITTFPFEINATLSGRYLHRMKLPSASVFDVTLVKAFEPVDIIISATNIFNSSFEEIPSVPLPGRWIIGKVRWNLL